MGEWLFIPQPPPPSHLPHRRAHSLLSFYLQGLLTPQASQFLYSIRTDNKGADFLSLFFCIPQVQILKCIILTNCIYFYCPNIQFIYYCMYLYKGFPDGSMGKKIYMEFRRHKFWRLRMCGFREGAGKKKKKRMCGFMLLCIKPWYPKTISSFYLMLMGKLCRCPSITSFERQSQSWTWPWDVFLHY